MSYVHARGFPGNLDFELRKNLLSQLKDQRAKPAGSSGVRFTFRFKFSCFFTPEIYFAGKLLEIRVSIPCLIS